MAYIKYKKIILSFYDKCNAFISIISPYKAPEAAVSAYMNQKTSAFRKAKR
ncbi:hypothetical protein CLOHYLEM_05240 [[Clostridium] hylemonae DSM 15053]|uniref:Uncharacterized protein n=1 Tax=[Clostridium] hylemonae DSM 15053 TaxID=553973 RepID=C0BZK0_9FIRM|nr:hypothetical protein CLOHYLEM_05240 [[Clostridium] hylemonae DSM 15053]